MKQLLTLSAGLLLTMMSNAQQWVDTLYSIQTNYDITYGITTGFAGQSDTLDMDISVPTGDTPPSCGRPLMVIVHGGAWYAGDKNIGYPKTLREDFSKRGYVTASVNYRLGLFNTNAYVNCNVPDWNCYNMTDTSEWYRANYRGIQDVNGAIRYLINNENTYNIDPQNVFIVGESAGGFIAMGVGFIDDQSEVLTSLISAYPDAPAPNNLYESNCIQTYNLADDIDSMDLSRPDMGSYSGTLNNPVNTPYKIRAVGNLFGGAFNNIFQSFDGSSPGLYLFHQPCDLIVPFNHSKLLAGYNSCMMGFPANCASIVNRPYAYGSQGIKNLIDDMVLNGIPTADYYFDNSGYTYDCIQQFADPNLACHALDAYWLRTGNMADYFAGKIVSCGSSKITENQPNSWIKSVYPNPSSGAVTIEFSKDLNQVELILTDLLGKKVATFLYDQVNNVTIDLSLFEDGVYLIHIKSENQLFTQRIIVENNK